VAVLFLALVSRTDAVEMQSLYLPWVSDLVADTARQLVYVNLPFSGVVAIVDPAMAEVTGLLPEITGRLAIDQDSRYLYSVSSEGVARTDLASRDVDLEFSLHDDVVTSIQEVEVVPGRAESIVVTYLAGGERTLAIYDDGVRRPNTVAFVGTIEFGADTSRIYGHHQWAEDGGFYRFAVDEAGISLVDVTFGMITLTRRQLGRRRDVKFDGGLLFTATGLVIEPEQRAIVQRISGLPEYAYIHPEAETGRMYVAYDLGFDAYNVSTGKLEQHTLGTGAVSWINDGLVRLGMTSFVSFGGSPATNSSTLYFLEINECGGHPLGCEEGNPCNGLATCGVDNECILGIPVDCGDDGNICNGIDVCQPLTGSCVREAIPECDDADPCNGTEFCDRATGCVAGVPIQCDDGDVCNGVEECGPHGECLGGPIPLCVAEDDDACTIPKCDPGTGCVEQFLADGTCWRLEGTSRTELVVGGSRVPTRRTPYAGTLDLYNDGRYYIPEGPCAFGEGRTPAESGRWVHGPRDRMALRPANASAILEALDRCADLPSTDGQTGQRVRRWIKLDVRRGRTCGSERFTSGNRHLCGLLQTGGHSQRNRVHVTTRIRGELRSP